MPSDKSKLAYHLILQVALMAVLSLISGYQTPDFSDSNWLTVNFLTPFGIVTNHLDSQSVIRSFYSDTSRGQVALSSLQITAMSLIYFFLLMHFIFFVPNVLRPRK